MRARLQHYLMFQYLIKKKVIYTVEVQLWLGIASSCKLK